MQSQQKEVANIRFVNALGTLGTGEYLDKDKKETRQLRV
jgi:hypothetical protein